MSGALFQMAAVGPQNEYINSNPEGTLFKKPYKRVTLYAAQHIAQNFQGNVDFGRKVTCDISRSADLIHRLYVRVSLPTLTGTGTQAWTRNIGNVLLQEIELEIGNTKVDKHYGIWLHIWAQLTEPASMEATYNTMIGNTTTLTTEAATITAPTQQLLIPLRFWFCRELGLSLPAVALQYNTIKVNVQFRNFADCYVSSSGTVTVPTLTNADLLVEYIYLDVDERRKFAQTAHEYLIEQLQFTGTESFSQTSVNQRLNFNHPCKAFYWVSQLASNVQSVAAAGALANRWTDFTDNGTGPNPYEGNDPLVSGKLQFNGIDRFDVMGSEYFNLLQPYEKHTRGCDKGIYMWSAADAPEEHQPTGSVNMSRIDTAVLNLTMSSSAAMNLYTFATNNNVFRIFGGQGSVAYSS